MIYMACYVTTNELYHHGILGMHWGIRRYQPYPKGKHGTFLGQSRDDDIRIKKGTEAYRVSGKKNLTKEEMTFIAMNKLDNLSYVGYGIKKDGVAMDAKGNDNDGRPYNLTLIVSKDLIAPSYQKTMDLYIKSIVDSGGASVFNEEIKDAADEWRKEMFTSDWKHIEKYRKKGDRYIKKIGEIPMAAVRDGSYEYFVETLSKADTSAKKIFFDSLKEEGYNAIVDDWDAKFGQGVTKTPMIVLEPDALKLKKSKSISDKDAKEALDWLLKRKEEG